MSDVDYAEMELSDLLDARADLLDELAQVEAAIADTVAGEQGCDADDDEV